MHFRLFSLLYLRVIIITSMKKTKNTQSNRHKITTVYGFGLFAAMALSYVLTTLMPMLFAFQYPGARHLNIGILIAVFGVASLLPALVAYFAGDKATHSKKRTLHHYNGVLFGFAAYWLTTVFSWFGFGTMVPEASGVGAAVAANVIPAVLAILVMIAVSIAYATKQKKDVSILHFGPYQVVLLIGIIGAFLIPSIINGYSSFLLAALGFIVPSVVALVAYVALRNQKIDGAAKLTDALVALTIGWIAVSIGFSLNVGYEISGLVSYGLALAIFVSYLYLRAREIKA